MKSQKLLYGLSLLLLLLSACRPARRDVIILFDNDVHCAVEAYVGISALRDSALVRTPYVSVVSAGDFVQGDVMGSISRGEYIVDIMNAVPYDVVTIGNHEFDYGMEQQRHLAERLTADVVCCNFTNLEGTAVYPSSVIRRFGPVDVAFVGVATPTSYTSSTPAYFQDSTGRCIYDFHAESTFALIQQTVDAVRKKGADYVIVLSHLGDDTPIDCSLDMVAATHGIDVVLDGHAHHFLDLCLPNADGDSIWLLSTGSRGTLLGELCLQTDGTIAHRFVTPKNDESKSSVAQVIQQKQVLVESLVSEVVGYAEVTLCDADAQGTRLVRNSETNLSDFVADAMRYAAQAQIGCIHGGSLRAPIQQGVITQGNLIALLPFNNHLARVSMTGQQLVDALEVSVATYPVENGDFHIFSGLRYTIDEHIPSSVLWEGKNMFAGIGATRRVVRVEVEDMQTKKWKPIDLQAIYTIGGLDYTLLRQGSSYMFRYAVPLPCEHILDTEVLIRYLHAMGDTVRVCDYPFPNPQPRFNVK